MSDKEKEDAQQELPTFDELMFGDHPLPPEPHVPKHAKRRGL